MDTDSAIMLGIMKKDQHAFEALVDKYGGLIKSVVRYHLAAFSAYAEDCENDILLSIWQNADRFDSEKNSLKNWIGAVSKYKCIDYKRKYCKELETENIDDKAIAKNDVYSSLQEDISALLEALPEADRQLFYRHYILGERVEDIAHAMHSKTSLLYNRLSRGRKKLKKCIQGSDINEK